MYMLGKIIKIYVKALVHGFRPTGFNKGFLLLEKIKKSELKNEILAITRIRNEELIIDDTLSYLSDQVDDIIVFDDDSTDGTLSKVLKCNKVSKVICNLKWKKDRTIEETQNRAKLLELAKKSKSEWIYYADADERIVENIKSYLSKVDNNVDSIYVTLFDAYITKKDLKPYKRGTKLIDFREYFGPEYRNILMLWRNKEYFSYQGIDKREPDGAKNSITALHCQHYGKAISVEQWEETCEYYCENFPEPYKSKWQNRKGKAIHETSDFGNKLYKWGKPLYENKKELQ